MTVSPVLYAKGYDKTDGETPVYFWGLGNYKYEIESRPTEVTPVYLTFSNVLSDFDLAAPPYTYSDVFEASYEDARKKFESMIEPDTEVIM